MTGILSSRPDLRGSVAGVRGEPSPGWTSTSAAPVIVSIDPVMERVLPQMLDQPNQE
jgi:hypothetical protein